MCIFLSLLSFTAWAQMSGGREGDNSGIHQASSTSVLTEKDRQVYASAMFGNGAAYGKNVTGERTMEWKAFEIRFGKEMDTSDLHAGGIFSPDEKLRFDVLLSMALRVDLDHLSPGMDIRLALNHVTMPGAHSSNALLAGVGKQFSDSPSHTQPEFSRNPVWLGMAAINANTNPANK